MSTNYEDMKRLIDQGGIQGRNFVMKVVSVCTSAAAVGKYCMIKCNDVVTNMHTK
jgi:hypothetical protein